uniref:Uncharacterized protein n=1 Tax=Candidatus Kentrum sp. LFY TaxID=2126342 RepID=A0A450U7E8_9GAMM|nr:MAG: hypothetical protein BECKLFY1418B_GA0070995_100753 [Candidatus Kentron sp. LFY]
MEVISPSQSIHDLMQKAEKFLRADIPDNLYHRVGGKNDYHGIDYRNNPVFATAYLAEENEHESMKWLDVEFRDFFL